MNTNPPESVEPPPALVLGCNTPHGVGVLSDWIEEQTGHAPDFVTGFPVRNIHEQQPDRRGGGVGTGYGYGFENGDGSGDGWVMMYADFGASGFGDGYGYSGNDGTGSGIGDGNGLGNGVGGGDFHPDRRRSGFQQRGGNDRRIQARRSPPDHFPDNSPATDRQRPRHG